MAFFRPSDHTWPSRQKTIIVDLTRLAMICFLSFSRGLGGSLLSESFLVLRDPAGSVHGSQRSRYPLRPWKDGHWSENNEIPHINVGIGREYGILHC